MERKKKRRIRKRLRALLILLLIVLLLLLLDGRFGLGDGLNLLSSNQDNASSVETESPSQSDATLTIEVVEQSILLMSEDVTLDELSNFLATHDEETLFILIDQRANNALFNEVEALLKSYDLLYAVQD